jgi:hypothetical protein
VKRANFTLSPSIFHAPHCPDVRPLDPRYIRMGTVTCISLYLIDSTPPAASHGPRGPSECTNHNSATYLSQRSKICFWLSGSASAKNVTNVATPLSQRAELTSFFVCLRWSAPQTSTRRAGHSFDGRTAARHSSLPQRRVCHNDRECHRGTPVSRTLRPQWSVMRWVRTASHHTLCPLDSALRGTLARLARCSCVVNIPIV